MERDRKEYWKEYRRAWRESHKDEYSEYQKKYKKAEVNSLGKTKNSIRCKSNYFLKKHGTIITGYEIHHCCTYNEPYKFIYCTRELHTKIHQYLRDNNIDADSYHYEQIKHLLDDTAVLYGLD